MMFRRLIAYIFILTANILLLAYAIFPHHHHEHEICLQSTHCSSDSHESDETFPLHEHQHNDTDTSDCILKQLVFIQFNNEISKENNDVNTRNQFISSFLYIAINPPLDFYNNNSVAISLPGLMSNYSGDHVNSSGLRAPPAV